MRKISYERHGSLSHKSCAEEVHDQARLLPFLPTNPIWKVKNTLKVAEEQRAERERERKVFLHLIARTSEQ